MKKYIILMCILCMGISSNSWAQYRRPTTVQKIFHIADQLLFWGNCSFSGCHQFGYHQHYYNNSYQNVYVHQMYYGQDGGHYCQPQCNHPNINHRYQQRTYANRTYVERRSTVENIWCPFQQGVSHAAFGYNEYGQRFSWCFLNNCQNPHYINRAYRVPLRQSNYNYNNSALPTSNYWNPYYVNSAYRYPQWQVSWQGW